MASRMLNSFQVFNLLYPDPSDEPLLIAAISFTNVFLKSEDSQVKMTP